MCSSGPSALLGARTRVWRVGVDVQQALECSPMGIAAVMLVVWCCCSWDLVSVDSLDDVASTLLLRNCAQGVALFAQWLAGCIQSLRNAEYNGRSSVRMSACACG